MILLRRVSLQAHGLHEILRGVDDIDGIVRIPMTFVSVVLLVSAPAVPQPDTQKVSILL